jgi:hypothetical protein
MPPYECSAFGKTRRRFVTRFLCLVVAGLVMSNITATAQTAQRVRGTIESVQDDALTVKPSDGGDSRKVTITADSKFAFVVPSDLDAIKPGVFIGTATKGPDNHPIALEVVVFPDSMRGTAEGHYPWDMLPDTAKSGAHEVKSSMTNGAVAAAKKPSMVHSAMTNGTVKTDTNKANGKRLSVSFSGGKTLSILVPPNVPIVAFEPSDRSILAVGAKVFIVAANANGTLAAKLVAVGKNGLTPPM